MIGNKTGKLGEDIAELFLVKRGFDVFTRNYLKKYGEIDLIVKKQGIIHFVEVKAVTRENLDSISHETDTVRPEENLHEFKLKSLSKVIQVYLMEHKDVKDWKFDLCVVYIDLSSKKAKVRFLEDLVLPE